MTPRDKGRDIEFARGSKRTVNARRLLEVLRVEGPSSQATLARRMELSPATVSNLVRDLRDEGLADVQPLNGRESLVTLVANEGAIAAVQINVYGARAALFDFAHRARYDADIRFDESGEAGGTPETVAALVERVANQAGIKVGDLAGLAVGMQGPLDRRSGAVTSWARVSLPGWRDVAVEAVLAEALDLPVVAENDANLAALAEWTWGVGRGSSEFLYLMCSSGIGGGIILDGKIYHGSDGLAGEIGHLVLEPGGPVCFCGSRGCLTTFASERSILLALEASGSPADSLHDVIESARQGSPASRAVLFDAGRYLGRAIVGAAKVMAPGVIAVGGLLSEAGPLVFNSLESSVEINSLRAASPNTRVVPATINADATLLGGVAAMLAQLGRGVSSLPDWAQTGRASHAPSAHTEGLRPVARQR